MIVDSIRLWRCLHLPVSVEFNAPDHHGLRSLSNLMKIFLMRHFQLRIAAQLTLNTHNSLQSERKIKNYRLVLCLVNIVADSPAAD